MKRHLAIASALALTLAVPGLAVAQQDPASPNAPAGSQAPMSTPPSPGSTTTGTAGPAGTAATATIKGNGVIGADVRGSDDKKIGAVNELLMTPDGQVDSVVVSIGGIMGVGDHKVQVPWEQLRFSNEGSRVVVVAMASKDELSAMPEYKDPAKEASDRERETRREMNAQRPIRQAPAE